jgi:hypothetical protein
MQRALYHPICTRQPQIKHKTLLNEHLFSSSIQGAFQICDNPLARKYFLEDELVIAQNVKTIVKF